jgi:hypothetical protein
MSYRLHRFGDVNLPIYNIKSDFSQGQVESTLLDSVGGTFDYYGTRRRLPRKQNIGFTGLYLGERSYLVDHLGNRFVDHLGNPFITGSGTGGLLAQLEAIYGMLGKRDRLYRQYFDDSTRLEWKQARLLNIQHQRENEDTELTATLSFLWETNMIGWRSENATETELESGTGERSFSVQVDGTLDVYDAIITITATNTTSSIYLQNTTSTAHWRWTGSLLAGNDLVIDCGTQTVFNNGTSAYTGIEYQASHLTRGIFPLYVGANSININSNAEVSVVISHYNQYI